ncbi:platelet glycoprotein VI-like [Calonectris borealis]|uniref:platelet glycoprotein VI-like n=1 Tax=Calonectris borealis TaxID=1323832 RepID=UPI003F4C6E10
MGTRVLLLLLGCWGLRPGGASGPPQRPELRPREGLWVPAGAPFHFQCFGPGPLFLLLHQNRSGPVANVTSRRGFVTFARVADAADAGPYTCRCWDPPGGTPRPPGPSSNPVEVVVTDPRLDPPKLSLPPLQPLPVPRGTNVSVVCEGPPGAATFRLYRGGPGGAVGQRAGGGVVPFPLGPLHPRHEGAYFCTYSPAGGGVSGPSPPLLLLVEGGSATPKSPNWPGCEYWGGSH